VQRQILRELNDLKFPDIEVIVLSIKRFGILKMLETLKKSIIKCDKCSLCGELPLGPVFGIGKEKSRIMLLGEAAGKDEAVLEEPFVGQCGQLLDKMLFSAGLKRRDLYITNVIKARPTKNDGRANRPPSDVEIAACKGWLWKEIQLVQPKCIITLGKVPTYTLLRSQLKKSFKLGDSVGVEYVVDYCDSRIFPSWHPSYLMLHGKKEVDSTVNLFKELKERFYGPRKAKNS
jgi:DNA polymerase